MPTVPSCNLVKNISLCVTWFLFVKCENVSLPALSVSTPPAPESLSASPPLNEPDQRWPGPPGSAGQEEEELRTQRTADNLYVNNIYIFNLTWSLNMREMTSNTCMLHCCSLWADARNFTRSSKPLMWMAHSSLSWMLASSSTFYRKEDRQRLGKEELEVAEMKDKPRGMSPWE